MLSFLKVGTAFTVDDKGVRAFFDSAVKGADKFGASAERAGARASKGTSSFLLMAVKGIAAYRALGYGIDAVRGASTEFLDLDDAVRRLAGEFGKFDPQAKSTQELLDSLSAKSRKLGREFGFSGSEVAKALLEIKRAGVETMPQIEGLAPTILSFVKVVGEGNPGEATKKLVTTMHTFNKMSKDPLILAQNMTRMADLLSAAASKSVGTIGDMVDAVTTGGGAAMANALDMSAEKFLALSAALVDTGLDGKEVGYVLKNIQTRLIAPQGDAVKWLAAMRREFGFTTKDAKGAQKDVMTMFRDLNKAIGHLSGTKQAEVYFKLFNARAVGGALNVRRFTDRLEDMAKWTDANGSLMGKNALIVDGWREHIKRLGIVVDNLAGRFFEAFGIKGKGGIDALAEALDRFDPAPIAEGLKVVGSVIGFLIDNIKGITAAIAGATAAWLVFKAAGMYSTLLMVGERVLIVGAMFLDLAKAQGIATAAAWLFNAALWANPLTWIVIAVGAVVAALVYLELKFKVVSKALKWVWDLFEGIGAAIYRVVDAIAKLSGTGLPPLTPTWSNTPTQFGSAGFGNNEVMYEPPNAARVQLQQAQWNGRLTIAGAPAGSTMEQSVFGAPPVDVQLLGVAP